MALNFIGQFYGCVGIANHARSFADALSYEIDDVRLRGIFPNVNNDKYGLNDNLNSRFKELDPIAPTLVYWYPDTFPKLLELVPNSTKKIGYYIFEYTKIQKNYIDIMNSLDAVCTPSPWGVEVLKNNGLTVPAFSIPGGVDHGMFNSKNKNLDQKRFKFIHVGKKENRKSTATIITAFAKAFRDNRKVRMTLFINNHHIPGFTARQFVIDVLSNSSLLDQIDKFEIRNFEDDMCAVYNSHHAAVFASKSEGIGLPILESMACGLPTITTKNSAMLDYVNGQNSIILDKQTEELVYDPHFFPNIGERGTWQSPSEDEIIEKIKWVYDNYDAATAIGNSAEEWVKNNYNWKLAAQAFKQKLQTL